MKTFGLKLGSHESTESWTFGGPISQNPILDKRAPIDRSQVGIQRKIRARHEDIWSSVGAPRIHRILNFWPANFPRIRFWTHAHPSIGHKLESNEQIAQDMKTFGPQLGAHESAESSTFGRPNFPESDSGHTHTHRSVTSWNPTKIAQDMKTFGPQLGPHESAES